jgi:two-component system, OmpR family, sensor histidine kinase SenX3
LGTFGTSAVFQGHIVNLVNNFSLAVIFLTIAVAVVGSAIAGFTIGRRGFRADSNSDPIPFPTLAAEVLELFGSVGILLDSSNQVVRMNNRAESFGLVTRGLLVHSDLVDLATSARSSKQVESYEGVLRVGLQQEKISVSAKASLVANDYVVLVLEDRTRDMRLDKTRRDFIENISHELKTPIGAIALLAEAIEGAGDDPATIEKFAGNLRKESNRLTLLVQDIIELSRLQSAEVLAQAELVDLRAVVADAVDRNEQLAAKRNVKIVSDQGIGLEVFGNKEMLTAAVKNLIENAISYSDSGSQVGIGCSAKDSLAEIVVTDSGAGISPENQERVFERFYRVDPSRSRETGGTGLGLSIVKHVAKIHRGDVKLFSQLGVGSTFTLRIPLATASDPVTGTIKLISEAN